MNDPASPPARAAFPAGFSLLEILVTVGALGVLASFSMGLISSASTRAARLQAEGELALIASALEQYRRQLGDYPQTSDTQQLRASLEGQRGPSGDAITSRNFLAGSPWAGMADPSGGSSRDPLLDPWGTAYRYVRRASPAGEYSLWSAGPDREDAVGSDGFPDPDHPSNRDNLSAFQP